MAIPSVMMSDDDGMNEKNGRNEKDTAHLGLIIRTALSSGQYDLLCYIFIVRGRERQQRPTRAAK